MRQQDSRSPSQERRGIEIASPGKHNSSDFRSSRSKSNTPQRTLPTRQVQLSSRSPIASSLTAGMALTTGLRRDSFCEVGNTGGGSICLGNSPCGTQLCITRPERPSSDVPRRIQYSVELPARVGVPTTFSDAQSPLSLEPIDRDISGSGASLGQSVLAGRSQSPSASSATYSEEPAEESRRHDDRTTTCPSRGNDSRGLEVWGWSEALESWSSDQLLLLKNSWRKSTLRTYKTAWQRWISWASTKNINPKNPTGAQLAQFLSDLHLINKLSYNTILLHKSVVSTLCNTETSSCLSSHVLVKHILKSISLTRPKTVKPPVWDVDQLIKFLSDYTVDQNNVFQTTRHTATLLLLCSGRRIHDLTLLTIDHDNCIRSDECIIFWPQFGSKTDSSNYRQSGWKLLANTSNSKLNPLFWIERTISLLNDRRNTAKSFNLFMTLKGRPQPASRTVIANWIKTLFKEANIAAAPGSIRSAVASKSWWENHSLDDIMARGNWQSANTFQRFYRREVARTSTSSTNVTRLFNPV
ncbi:uncharacterized protein LOC134654001 [Cydia amplana]|uniref:uncharacterized protein LOC134654001 n=1 Tax=Cydia amplana TaxID=1869771 RepID=UPI002FE60FF1